MSGDDDGPGMMLDEGTPIDASQPAPGGLLKVRVHGRWDSDLKVTGYIPASQVGIEYPERGGLSLMQFADVSLPVRFQLLDAPHGSPFVVSANRKRVPGKLIKREGGATLVRISEGAVGWIASSQLRPVPESAHESVGMDVAVRIDPDCEHYDASDPVQAARCGPDPENTLAVGAHLFDAPDGRWVGVVTPYFRSPPPPPSPPPPMTVALATIEPLRIRGAAQVAPDDAAKAEIARSGKDKLLGVFRLCIDETGAVVRVTQIKSTFVAAYDAQVMAELRAWAFRPYVVHGVAAAVCTIVTIHDPPTAPSPPSPAGAAKR